MREVAGGREVREVAGGRDRASSLSILGEDTRTQSPLVGLGEGDSVQPPLEGLERVGGKDV